MDTRVQVIMVYLHLEYNGQTSIGQKEIETHVVTRVSYPFVIGSQIIEPGIQAYTGKWAFEISSGVTVKDKQYTIDQRVATLYCIQNHLVSKQNIILVKDLVITN
jgi:hypothetical protein